MSDTWADYVDIYTCPECGKGNCVPAYGYRKSPILIIGIYPGEDEIREGRPMVGRSGGILRTELQRNKIDPRRTRMCNLWLHKPNKKKIYSYGRDKCFDYGAQEAIKEAQGRQAILLIGADTVRFFCNQSVEATNGLEVQSDYLSAPLIMSCIQPATIFHGGGVGEIRLTIQKFSKRLEELLG